MGILNNGVLIAIIAQGMIGASLVWDKILLQETRSSSVVNYVFWLGGMSLFGSILAVFGMTLPPVGVILTAFGAGVIHLAANYFYYEALQEGEASETLAIMGGFSPVATALIAIPLLRSHLAGLALWGFAVMTAGGFFMFFSERIARGVLPPMLLSAGFFGLTNVIQKIAFNKAGFIAGYVFFTLGTFAGALFFLVRRKWRNDIFTQSEQAQPSSKFWYFVNRFVNGFGSFLIFLAISHANPAIVDAISGLRYAVIFLGAYLITRLHPQWLRENFKGWTIIAKIIATLLVIAGLFLVGMARENDSGNGVPAARLRPASFYIYAGTSIPRTSSVRSS